MKYVLTIDIGTTSAKALLVSQDGEVSFSSQEFYPTHFSSQGWAEQDPSSILQAINRMVAGCASQYADKISAISLSCAMHSIVAVDRAGNPLSPLIIWSDMRSAGIAKSIRATPKAASLQENTGTPIHPMSPLCKLIWLKQNDQPLFERAFKFVSIKEFLVWHWCGEWLVDYSVASSSGLFDIRKLNWSNEAVKLTGVSIDQLSKCVSPYHQMSIKTDVVRLLGFDKSISLVMGASDGCLAHIGSDATQQGDISLTIGTSGAVRKMSTKASHDPLARLFNYRLDESSFITGGATNNGTAVVDWFRKNFCKSEEGSLQEFVQQACTVSARSQGLIFLPFVLGERSPYYEPDLRGVFFGLAQHHSLQHMMRSLLEGICFEMKTLVDAVSDTVGPIDRVLASGGFIRSPEWVQMLSNVLGREITVRDVNDASSIGAGIIGFRSLGVQFNFQTVEASRFMPDKAEFKSYEASYRIFSRLVKQLSSEFGEITALQKS